MDISDYYMDLYKKAKKEHFDSIKTCNDLIVSLAGDISFIDESNLPYQIEDYAKMHMMSERMHKILYMVLYLEDLSYLSNYNTNDKLYLKELGKMLNEHYNSLVQELDRVLNHCVIYKYSDYRCVDIIHKWSDICNFYKTFLEKMATVFNLDEWR